MKIIIEQVPGGFKLHTETTSNNKKVIAPLGEFKSFDSATSFLKTKFPTLAPKKKVAAKRK